MLFNSLSFGVFLAVVLALVSGLIAGVYPAWRACRVVKPKKQRLNPSTA